MIRRPKIVVIGGGTGTFTVLTALKPEAVDLTAIVSMADNGGSSGVLRDEYGVLPPGDIRRALVALAESSDQLRDLFNYRFKNGGLENHSFGNLFLTAFEQMTGNFGQAVKEMGEILRIKGRVIPVTLQNTHLHAKLSDGTTLNGETSIDTPQHHRRAPIEKIWLKPSARLNPEAKQAIMVADTIIIGPGDIFTSLLPSLLVTGMSGALKKAKARKIYLANLMTKPGETDNWTVTDFLKIFDKYLGRNIFDYAIFNNKKPSAKLIQKYKTKGAEFVDSRSLPTKMNGVKIILADLLDRGELIRHDSNSKLPKVLMPLLNSPHC